jgi:hypothetical protein
MGACNSYEVGPGGELPTALFGVVVPSSPSSVSVARFSTPTLPEAMPSSASLSTIATAPLISSPPPPSSALCSKCSDVWMNEFISWSDDRRRICHILDRHMMVIVAPVMAAIRRWIGGDNGEVAIQAIDEQRRAIAPLLTIAVNAAIRYDTQTLTPLRHRLLKRLYHLSQSGSEESNDHRCMTNHDDNNGNDDHSIEPERVLFNMVAHKSHDDHDANTFAVSFNVPLGYTRVSIWFNDLLNRKVVVCFTFHMRSQSFQLVHVLFLSLGLK